MCTVAIRCDSSGPCHELSRNLEWACGEAIEQQVWECPFDGKSVNPRAGRRNCPDVSFTSILRNHIARHKHRKNVGNCLTPDAAFEPERGGSPVIPFPCRGRDGQICEYFFNSLSGAQGWRRDEAELEADECEFNRPEWWNDALPPKQTRQRARRRRHK